MKVLSKLQVLLKPQFKDFAWIYFDYIIRVYIILFEYILV